MFDIIIKDGKKESYIKLNGNKIEGFNALNGVVTPLTIKEVNTINLLKLSDDKNYLGQENDYDIYVDNISGLKHYFKDGKEDYEATWLNNGEDALIYKGDKIDKIKNELKSFPLNNKILLISSTIWLIAVTSSLIEKNYEIKKMLSLYDSVAISTEYTDTVTLEQIEKYVEENDKLTKEEKEMFYNEKLLQDVILYYENTNMNILIPLKFDDLQTNYYYKEPLKNELEEVLAYYDLTKPNRIFVNTYYEENSFYDSKVHEYIHLLQASRDYKYIREASAEIISCEYDNKCTIDSYKEPVKNLKILMEIVGPEPVWKLNFSADDTDLVNIIRANLEEEKADILISLLKEKPGKNQREGLDEDIASLLSQLYTNMYDEEIRTNPFIYKLLEGDQIKNRYYFNSELIESKIPCIEIANPFLDWVYWDAYVVSNNYSNLRAVDIFDKNSEELFILCKVEKRIYTFPFTTLLDLTDEMIKENEIKFYYHGEEISYNSINLSMYKNEYINMFTTVITDTNGIPKTENKYLPTIYESFPDQRIGGNEIKNNTY